MQNYEKDIIISFLVAFPFFILTVFVYLVTRHYNKLFGPSNFRNEDNYVKMQLHAVASLTAAASKDHDGPSQQKLDKIVDAVGSASAKRQEAKRYLLWVDDRPENNIHERRAFEAIGINFSLSLSTDDALEQINKRKFDAIISDMGRVAGPREGYVLLDKLRKQGNETPLFFYASSNAPEHKRETKEHGGQGCTNDGQELFEMVVSALIKNA